MEHGVNGVNGVVWKENFEKDIGYHVIVRCIHIIREHVSDFGGNCIAGNSPHSFMQEFGVYAVILVAMECLWFDISRLTVIFDTILRRSYFTVLVGFICCSSQSPVTPTQAPFWSPMMSGIDGNINIRVETFPNRKSILCSRRCFKFHTYAIASNHLTISIFIRNIFIADGEDKLSFYSIPFQVLGRILRIRDQVGPPQGVRLDVIRVVGGIVVLVIAMRCK